MQTIPDREDSGQTIPISPRTGIETNTPQMPPKWPGLEFAMHPLAPTFAQERDPRLLLQHIITEASSPNMSTSDKILQLLREAGFVSLWFYLKFIAGSAGPYNLLNEELHVDMCNFRQRVATTPGIKAMGLVPRACYKSTLWTHGPNSWELLRNPNLRIGCTSQIYDRALSFVQTTINTFTENELHKALYPEYKKENRSNTELILTNRTRKYPEPNLQAITAGGSTQGIHVDLFNPDDIVGEDMLNADHVAGAEMAKMGNWLYSNLRTLVVSWKHSRVMGVGTRYAIDDPYERAMRSAKEHVGYWNEMEGEYPLDERGDWVVYYRPAKQLDEAGVEYSINPEAFSVEQLAVLAEEDPWVYASQYANNPIAAGASDFAGYDVREFDLEWNETQESYEIVFDEGITVTRIDLRDCDVVIAGDPSGGETRANTKSSRASCAVVARSSKNKYFVLDAEVGYVAPTKFFDWLFHYKAKYGHRVRATYVETQAGFKSFVSIIRKEERLRGKFLNFLGIPALGDKEATIRNILQPLLEKNALYVRKQLRGKVMEEVRVFPSRKMDLLDALKIAVFKSNKPKDSVDDDDGDDRRKLVRRRVVSKVTGY